jgi:phospholipase D1/2
MGWPVLEAGRNCWRIARASRAALLVDGADYFERAAAAMERAERSILILGWDLHSRIRLRRRGEGESDETLSELLDRLARGRRGLQIHALVWDFAMLYAFERESLPRVRLGYATHRRVHFRLDGDHPLGASQHQKLLVVDDALAFVGGLDLTACRWDTPEHRAEDARRRDPGFSSYGPFHDVQIAVDGAAAAALGDLARERWRRATGKRLKPVRGGSDPWPESLAAAMCDVDVGISRTEPAHDGRPEVREVERLHLDALRAARRYIYIENQYFTSDRIGELLVEILAREQGPEVVVVGPLECSGWLEEAVMGARRARLIEGLRAADHGDRFRAYHPVLPDGAEPLKVHSKVLVVDDQLLRVGSANLSNRSMGFDSECDLCIEARGREDVSAAIGGFRDRLLAEHLGAEEPALAAAIAAEGSLIPAIEVLRRGRRSLEPLETAGEPGLDLEALEALADPERPVQPEVFARHYLPRDLTPELDRPAPRSWLSVILGLLTLVALAALWRWTPLAELASVERLASLAEPLRASAWGPIAAVVVFTLAGLLMVPVMALIVASGLIFDGALGFATAFIGSLSTAAAGYAAGALLWRDAVRRLMGERANELSRRLGRRGVLAVVALRIVPVAPFTLVNIAAGASHIRWRDYALGTALGMGPGVLGLTLVADRLKALIREGRLQDVGWILALVALFVAASLGARRWLRGVYARGGGAPGPQGPAGDGAGGTMPLGSGSGGRKSASPRSDGRVS